MRGRAPPLALAVVVPGLAAMTARGGSDGNDDAAEVGQGSPDGRSDVAATLASTDGAFLVGRPARPQAGRPPITEAAVSSICLECGICCDGTMFTHCDLAESDDRARLTEIGLDVYPGHGTDRFRIPCRRFTGCCSVYDDRPSRCRTFRCRLLRDVEGGRTAPDEARDLVASVRLLAAAAHARLAAHLGDRAPEGLAAMSEVVGREIEESPDPAVARIERFDVLADYVALAAILKTRFRIDDVDGAAMPPDGVATG